MSVIRASNAPVGLSKGKPTRASGSIGIPATQWVRPSDWVAFTTPGESEQKVIGNVAVWNQSSNYVALSATTSTGTYTVDWGDGTSTTHTSGVTAEKNYVWGNLSSGTLTSQGYRQAIITVTPTTGGATFSEIRLDRRHSAITSASTQALNPWLDIAVAAPNATTIAFSYDTTGTRTARMQLCEQVTIVSQNTTNMTNLFRECAQLKSVKLLNCSSVTNMTNMFLLCQSLQSVQLLNTGSVTNMQSMFQECYSLQSVPLFNTASVTNMSVMFAFCYALQAVPLFNTAAVTTMANMFEDCYALQTVPLFNTAAVTSMASMFSGCNALQTVPLFNTAAVTNISGMFFSCYALQTVPLFNTAAVTNMSSMFSSCLSLRSVPLFNTAAVTSMSSMFANCNSLQTVPLFNTAAVTSMASMFSGCDSLQTVPLFNTAAVTSMAQMFSGCDSLQTVPLFDTAAVTNMSSMFTSCENLPNIPELTMTAISSVANNNLALGNATANSAAANLGQVKLTGNRWTQSFQNCKLGAAQLDEMYTALATLNPAVTTVSGNGTTVTYTVADRRAFVSGRTVTITGVDPSAYNLTNASIGIVTAGTGNAGTFTVSNAATGTYVSGGVAAIQSDRTITVTNNPGTTGDDPTIATNKGWTVTG